MAKYYVKRVNKTTGEVLYQRYKTFEFWVRNKDICWQFSRQGAKRIVQRYTHLAEVVYSGSRPSYDIEEVKE